jgi:hypothetical protein
LQHNASTNYSFAFPHIDFKTQKITILTRENTVKLQLHAKLQNIQQTRNAEVITESIFAIRRDVEVRGFYPITLTKFQCDCGGALRRSG